MKRLNIILFALVAFAIAGFVSVRVADARMMYGNYNSGGNRYAPGYMMGGYYAQPVASISATSSTAMDAEEAIGQALAQKLQAKTVSCSNLSDGEYESLGEYYMGLMMGSGHDAMDNYIVNRYGSDYDKQMHIAMGERFSGCNVNVSFPAGMMGFGPMMSGFGSNGKNNGYQGWQGSWSGYENGYGMMGWRFPTMISGYFGAGSWTGIITTVLFWAVLILAIVSLVRFLKRK